MSIDITRLDSGLTVASDAVAGCETASVGLWVDAGARHESADVNGIAHMLEHMAFKGTERRTARAIAEEIEAVGGHLNAHTSREHTAYYARILKGDMALAIDILADILQHSVFDAAELEREREVVIQEIHQAHDTPDDIVFDHLQAAAFPDQSLGRPILGTVALVGAFEPDTLRAYMASHYHAPRMVLAAAGGVDHARLVELAEGAFTALGPGTGAGRPPALYVGGDRRTVRDLEQVHLTLGFPGVAFDDADFYPAQVLATVLGGGMSSRLFQEVREKRGLAYSVFAYSSSYMDDGLFALYAGTGEGQVADLVPVLCGEVARAAIDVDEAETARARAQLKAGLLMSLESTSARCEALGRQMQIFGRPIPPREVAASIDAVDAAGVRRVAARLCAGTPVSVAAIGPIDGLMSHADIAARLA